MANEGFFRFLTVRAARVHAQSRQQMNKIPLYDDCAPKTAFLMELEAAVAAGQGRAEMVRIAELFRSGPLYVKDPSTLPFDINPVADFFENNTQKALKLLDVRKELETLYKNKLDKIVTLPEFVNATSQLADTILADILAGGSRPEVVVPFKLLFLFKTVLKLTLFVKGDDLLGRYITGSVVIAPTLAGVRPEPVAPATPLSRTASPEAEGADQGEARERVTRLLAAHRELAQKVGDDRFRLEPEPPSPPPAPVMPPDPAVAPVEAPTLNGKPLGAQRPSRIDPAAMSFVLSQAAVQSLSAGTKQVLVDLDLDSSNVKPLRAIKRIEDEVAFIQSGLMSPFRPRTLVRVGGVTIDRDRFRELTARSADKALPAAPALPLERCELRAGIADLLIVKQKLKAYEAGEFAHIENVLAGEVREREHRRLDLREETTTETTETETETERDLQSTERNELQAEAEKTVKEDTKLDAGLQVSGSYGPSVSFTASLNASFATSTEEMQRQSSSFSREVTEKTVEKVREKVQTERRLRTLSEIQEINKHSFNNPDPAKGNIRGIYRWMNKVYDAQVFSYGQRMMYDFVLPEPAAFLIYSLIENPPKEQVLVEPQPPQYNGAPLKAANLTRANYCDYLSAYQVTGAPTPPAQMTVVTFYDKLEGKDVANCGRAGKVKIPAGYSTRSVIVALDSVFHEGESHQLHVMVGGAQIACDSDLWETHFETLPHIYKGEISIAIRTLQIEAFAVAVDVICELDDADGFASWQSKVYDLIIQAYLRQKQDYDEKVAALGVQQSGVPMLGRNPIENRRLERDEIKKLVIMVMRNQADMDFDPFLPVDGPPVMDLAKVQQNAAEIQFFENAFEWNNILYVLYPYVWGRRARWSTALQFTDPDLDFAAFLKAGAARVQVPVRPGFERAVAHYSQFGTVWEGGEAPLQNDSLFVPIIDEVTESLGKLDGGVPYPAGSQSWEVRVPTSLVLLQDVDEVSAINDVLTGKPIDITRDVT